MVSGQGLKKIQLNQKQITTSINVLKFRLLHTNVSSSYVSQQNSTV